ncbi:MAG TPA: hypothetical protein VLA34_00050, partial [Candidatus Krumholzibacterium sp.]|nr:hypothetical protein [Candidatus Krumholzibacterium sp.]
AFVTHGSTYARHSATDGATDVAGDTFTSAGATFLTDIPNAAGNPILTTWLWLGSQERFYRVSFVTNDTTLELYVPPTAPNPPGSLSAQAYTVYTHNLINDSNKDGVALRLGNADDENNFGQFSYGAAPPYLTAGGPNGSTDQSLLFYMDADDWTSNASGPTYRLMEDTNTYDGQVHYFDEIVEIPATMVLDTDDLWLCVLPYDPADYAATGSFPVSVALYGLQMEYIPEDSATPENRLRQAFLQRGLASGVIGGTYSEKDILRDPIMSRVRLPVDVTAAVVRAGADRAAVGNARLDLFQGTLESTDLYLKYHTNGASDTMSILAIPLPLLPPGSILNTVNLELERTDGGTVNCSLWEFFERRIGYSPGSGEMIRKLGGQ